MVESMRDEPSTTSALFHKQILLQNISILE